MMTRTLFVFAAFTAAMTGCSGQSPTSASGPMSVVLRPAHPAQAGSVLTFSLIRVDNDSRCPVDVQCVSAGDATVVFTAVPSGVNGIGTAAMQFLHTNVEPRSMALTGYQITLDSLLPRPSVAHPIAPADYVAYMTVKVMPD